MQRFKHIVIKEALHIRRDRASMVMLIMMPVFFMLMFGYAVNTEVDHIYMGVLDNDHTYESRELVRTFTTSNYFELYSYYHDIKAIDTALDSGEIKTAIVIPKGYGSDPIESEIAFFVDGSDPTVARTALQSGSLIAQSQKGMTLQGNFRTTVWYNPSMESRQFTIPGLMGLIMQNITVMLTAFSLVRERERGTIEQLMVSPIKSYELIIGKMIPYVVIGNIDFLITIFFGMVWFNVPFRGSMALLLILGNAFIFSALAIGMLISTVSKNQLQAMQMSFLIILPSVLLSGFVFPRDAMPTFIYYIGYAIPLTYFLDILRGIIIKGVGFEIIWQQTLALTIMSILLLTIASIRFKKRLE
ncbi:ABC transporter permease [Fusibacter paucivorans]|nr:ABC transporter permease [Fusibacter paucivorans]